MDKRDFIVEIWVIDMVFCYLLLLLSDEHSCNLDV